MAQAEFLQPEVVLCVRIDSRATFSDDLGSFGLTVPPRAGEIARQSHHKEDFCLRRLLIAWKEAGVLSFPLTVERLKKPSGGERWPDFAVRQVQTGATIGIEVVEATDREYQAKLTAQAEEDAASDGEDFELDFVGHEDGWAGDGPERKALADIVRALRNKNRKALDGNYSGVPNLELLIYESIEAPLVDMNKVIQSLRKGKYKSTHLGFTRVNIISGETVWLDVFGAVPRPISLAANYDVDFVSWAREQAELARTAGGRNLDLPNVAEELESLGKRDARSRNSQLRRLLLHLLKWQFQPERRSSGNSWRESIDDSRNELKDIMRYSPVLDLRSSRRDDPQKVLSDEYSRARTSAARQTDLPLSTFPEVCPYSLEQIMDDNFLPGEPLRAEDN
jgi:hypothetical protein